MPDGKMLRLHLLELQAQMERQMRSLRNVLLAVSDRRRSAVAVAELDDIATRALEIAETASDARMEVLNQNAIREFRASVPRGDSAST